VIVVGIVGEIGSGKTYAAKIFENYGCNVFYADKFVHTLYKKNKLINLEISNFFKLKIKRNRVNLKDVSNLIIKNPNNLGKLNKIIHPEVKKNLLYFIRKNKKKKLIVLDIPLLLETDFKNFVNIVVFIKTESRNLKKFRMKRQIDIKLVNVLKKFQFNEEVKKNLSDFTIKNLNSRFLKLQIKNLINKITLND